MKFFRIKFSFIFLLINFISFSCGNKNKQKKLENRITVSGSDTMVGLSQKWAEKYMQYNSKINIQINGGGSGFGIAALINETTELVNASRIIKKPEIIRLKNKNYKVKEYKVALDALSVYVHIDNPINSFSFEQLKYIFRAKIVNWKKLGGFDAPIILYGRENSSGTHAYFKEKILLGKDFAQKVQSLPGTSSILDAVSKDPNGIAYSSKVFRRNIKVCKLKKDINSKGFFPTDENVLSNKYPLIRPLYIYTTDKIIKKNPEIIKFIKFIMSEKGQKMLKSLGYYSIK